MTMSTLVPPRFSVVIANFNYARYVGDAVRSALEQDGPPGLVEVIVVDDGSTDASREELAAFADDPRVQVVLQDNRGQAAAFEAGVQRARGAFICFLDSDDLFLPGKLSRVGTRIDELGVDADQLMLCHDLHIVDTVDGNTLDRGWFATMGIDRLGDTLDPARLDLPYPFAIPAGLVMGRGLAEACLGAMPSWDFRRGADSPLCMAAMLKVWQVHYLHEPLAAYRVHGANEAARVVDGHYGVGIRLDQRIPRLLSFLERWVDALDLPHAHRQQRLSCLRWLEHLNRTPSPARRLTAPPVSVAVMGRRVHDGDGAAQSVREQSHGKVSLWEADADPTAGPPIDDFGALAAAYRATHGDYLMFVGAGDRLDRECIERHLFWRQHGALVGVSCSDVRLCSSDGSLVHADVFANSGAWKQPLQQIPPLATRLSDWVSPPLAACLFRRNAFHDRLFDELPHLPEALRASAGWLMFQLQHHTGGVLRIRETLLSLRLPDRSAASYGYLSAPADLDGHLVTPPYRLAARWFSDFRAREPALFARWLPAAWHQRLDVWISLHD